MYSKYCVLLGNCEDCISERTGTTGSTGRWARAEGCTWRARAVASSTRARSSNRCTSRLWRLQARRTMCVVGRAARERAAPRRAAAAAGPARRAASGRARGRPRSRRAARAARALLTWTPTTRPRPRPRPTSAPLRSISKRTRMRRAGRACLRSLVHYYHYFIVAGFPGLWFSVPA